MELFIQIRDGQPYEHPIFGSNLRQAFPHIDTDNLPPEFARFERAPIPSVGAYEVYEGVAYAWVDGVVKDVHYVRPMTTQERQTKIDEVMARQPFTSWVFDEPSCSWSPPIPYPTDGKYYRWDEPTMSWVLLE